VKGNILKPIMKIMEGSDTSGTDVKYQLHDHLIDLEFHYPKDSAKQIYHLSGLMQDDNWQGQGSLSGGEAFSWTASHRRIDSSDLVDKRTDKVTYTKPAGHVLYPFTGLGFDTLPKQENVLFRNATVWTGEEDTELLNTDVLISGGKIKAIGKGMNAGDARVIDAEGKYLTAGIVDEHSHIAISGDVNEGTQSVTSEVRIGDVLNPEDIEIYRQLAGGVTESHLLHGSANCIGGQTQLIKMRFGYSAEQMKCTPWPGFIKFALGENVKQSNWGDMQRVRYPQSRMGVEQTIADAFTRAKAYQAQWKIYNSLSAKQKANTPPPRKNLELEALVEILEGKRNITCHSYVQSEINMLMSLADSMGFKVNTFTHILEGYKVADKMKAHGANASTFSDWWAYKIEVADAIPYNAALLTKMGVNTAVNSDDPEMARRLNQEAAKALKYGGLTKWQAWRLCTLNPAKMLHIDGYTGSIKPGKDADLVLWNNEPLSIYAHPLYTFVDGICYYDEQTDARKQQFIQNEKIRLRKKMLDAAAGGETTLKPKPELMEQYDCD
jgi:imidazolonepropionase-like amidohydrolase